MGDAVMGFWTIQSNIICLKKCPTIFLNAGIGKAKSEDQTHPLPIFVNELVLEHKHVPTLKVGWGRFLTMTVVK